MLFPLAGLPIGDAAKLVRVEGVLASLEPVAINIIGDYLDGRTPHDAAAERLRQEALTREPDALLAFAERYRTRVLAYPGGRTAVQQAIGGGGAMALQQLIADRPFVLRASRR